MEFQSLAENGQIRSWRVSKLEGIFGRRTFHPMGSWILKHLITGLRNKRVIQKIIPLNRKIYPRVRVSDAAIVLATAGVGIIFFKKNYPLSGKKKICMHEQNNAETVTKMHIFSCCLPKAFIYFFIIIFFFCRSRLVSKTHQRLFIHSFLLEISRKRLLLQDWAIKFWLALLLSPESFFFLRSRLVSKIHQHWFIHAFLLETFEKATLR